MPSLGRTGRVALAATGLAELALALAGVDEVRGQTVRGRAVDARTDEPVAGAVVRLVNPSGQALVVVAADSAGRFLLTAPRAGRYGLRGEQLGYRTRDTAPFDLGAGDDLSIDVRLEPQPIPIEGVEVTAEEANRRIRQFLGVSPGLLRVRPIRQSTIDDHVVRGDDLAELMAWARVPGLQVLRTREGPCFQARGRGCLPVYLDGARLQRSSIPWLPLEMMGTIVIVLPSEIVAYPEGAVHLLTRGYMR